MEAASRVTARFSGFVQGVGFRFTTRSIASRLSVRGYVKNLEDGRVELVAEGEIKNLETLLAEVRSQMGSNIRNVEMEWGTASKEYPGFVIRF